VRDLRVAIPFRGTAPRITQDDLAKILQLRAELKKRENTVEIAIESGATVDPGPIRVIEHKDGKIEIL